MAEMGWHVIIVWECELKPNHRQTTLESLAYTLNHIFLQDHTSKYNQIEEDHEFAAEPNPNE